ncbi:MAG: hypothetical protein KIS81_09860 [Maricaulaceae bacterium]|nr:hypothetical protein [Maricaulaceae bacterium]
MTRYKSTLLATAALFAAGFAFAAPAHAGAVMAANVTTLALDADVQRSDRRGDRGARGDNRGGDNRGARGGSGGGNEGWRNSSGGDNRGARGGSGGGNEGWRNSSGGDNRGARGGSGGGNEGWRNSSGGDNRGARGGSGGGSEGWRNSSGGDNRGARGGGGGDFRNAGTPGRDVRGGSGQRDPNWRSGSGQRDPNWRGGDNRGQRYTPPRTGPRSSGPSYRYNYRPPNRNIRYVPVHRPRYHRTVVNHYHIYRTQPRYVLTYHNFGYHPRYYSAGYTRHRFRYYEPACYRQNDGSIAIGAALGALIGGLAVNERDTAFGIIFGGLLGAGVAASLDTCDSSQFYYGASYAFTHGSPYYWGNPYTGARGVIIPRNHYTHAGMQCRYGDAEIYMPDGTYNYAPVRMCRDQWGQWQVANFQ